MTEGARDVALSLLRDPKILDRIHADFDRVGFVGEYGNRLIGYLAAVSRKLADPLAILVQSSSAAGKSSLMDAVLSLVPEEDRVALSAMTGQALYYMEPGQLRHKVLAIAEEQGAQRAAYALKLLQSEGVLTIASTAKEAGTGRMQTHQYEVRGPVALMMTTTAVDLDPELLNRCLVLSVDEGREQTRAIRRRQRERETLQGLLAGRERERVLHLHRNAQRLLRPIAVVNPFAPELTFADGTTRSRRDHGKYLALIRAIALLHQHQRESKRAEHETQVIEFIEVTREDIQVADRLMREVWDRAPDDLPPHTRRVLSLLDAMVTGECRKRGIERGNLRFTRRQAREHLGIGGTQLWIHLRRLAEAEFLIVHAARHGRGIVYELPTLPDPPAPTTTASAQDSGVVRAKFGPDSGVIRGQAEREITEKTRPVTHSTQVPVKKARLVGTKTPRRTSSAKGAR